MDCSIFKTGERIQWAQVAIGKGTYSRKGYRKLHGVIGQIADDCQDKNSVIKWFKSKNIEI